MNKTIFCSLYKMAVVLLFVPAVSITSGCNTQSSAKGDVPVANFRADPSKMNAESRRQMEEAMRASKNSTPPPIPKTNAPSP